MNFEMFVKSNNSSKDANTFAPSFGSAKMCGVSKDTNSCEAVKSYIAIITDIVFTMSVLLCLFVINAICVISIITLLISVIIINFNKLPKKQSTVECF